MYDGALIELLKITVPAYARSWSPTQHEWTIDARYARSLGNAMADPGCVIVGLDPPRQPKRDDTDPAHWAKAMFHRVGPTRHTAVYRAITDSYSWAPEPIVEVDFFAVGVAAVWASLIGPRRLAPTDEARGP